MRYLECPGFSHKFIFTNKDNYIIWNNVMTKIMMLINLVIGAQNSLFLDLSATLSTAYWRLFGTLSYLISKVPYPLVFLSAVVTIPFQSPFMSHPLLSCWHVPGLSVCLSSLAVSFSWWFHGFKCHPCANTFQSYIFILDLSPERQAHACNCLLSISTWIYVSHLKPACRIWISEVSKSFPIPPNGNSLILFA